MKRVNWFSGQQVQKEDLSYMQSALIDEVKSRTANQYSKGVVSPVGAYVVVDTNNTLRIRPFNAFTESGEQVMIPEDIRYLALDLTDDTNRQLGTQGWLDDDQFGWRSDTNYLIVAKYSEEAARPRPHYRTREPFATRIYSGFKFYAMREGLDPLTEGGVNPYIILARAIFTDGRLVVTTQGITEYASLSATQVGVTVGTNYTQKYDISQAVNVAQHIGCIGDATRVSNKNPHGITAEILGLDANAVPQHEKQFHADGFIGDSASVNSCFYTSINARNILVDQLVVHNLSGNDNLHYNGNTIRTFVYPTDKVYINLEDGSGLWTDCDIILFIDMRTQELGIAVASDNQTLVDTRTFRIIYGDQGQYTIDVSPIAQADLNTDYQYQLYSFSFSQEKQYTSIDLHGEGLNLSNFTSERDNRTFGSISSKNLQRNSNGDFATDFPIKVPAIKFDDGSILESANAYPPGYIDRSLRLYYQSDSSITVGMGMCKDSSNSILMSRPTEMTKYFFVTWASGTNQGAMAPGLTMSTGTWHVFLISTPAGRTDVAIDTDITAANCISADPTQASPIDGYRYYRRIGSLYIVSENSGSGEVYKIRKFTTYPDGGNGVTTIFLDTTSTNKQYIVSDASGNTILAVPSLYKAGASPKYASVTVQLSMQSPDGVVCRDYHYLGTTTQQGPDRSLGTGDNFIYTYNGCAYFSNTTWNGRVISYYDPRTI